MSEEALLKRCCTKGCSGDAKFSRQFKILITCRWFIDMNRKNLYNSLHPGIFLHVHHKIHLQRVEPGILGPAFTFKSWSALDCLAETAGLVSLESSGLSASWVSLIWEDMQSCWICGGLVRAKLEKLFIKGMHNECYEVKINLLQQLFAWYHLRFGFYTRAHECILLFS